MKISELTLAAQVNETDAFATTQSSGGGVFASAKTTLRMLADKIVTSMNFTSDLQTSNKTVSGAINEKIQSSSIAPTEVSPAESNHSVGEHITYNGERYKVTQAIVITDSLVVGTNIVKETVEESFEAGGGILPHIVINAQHGDTIVVNKGATLYYPVETESGVFEVDVKEFGTYTITIDNSNTIILLVDIVKVYTVNSSPEGSTVTPTDDVGIWLECGERTESYTTLSEILADSTCLSALISSENACDYLVRSTTFATAIVADSGAMALIGLNNYCANSLLADSTWLNAIANSAYVESVLNVKVPTMTGDTSPSGECIAKTNASGQQKYKAFDNDLSTTWSASTTTYDGTEYIGYGFTSAKKIYVAHFIPRYLTGYTEVVAEIKYQGSNDKSNWTDISSTEEIQITTTSTQTPHNTELTTGTNYQYYRALYMSRVSGATTVYPTVAELQFYGRDDV